MLHCPQSSKYAQHDPQCPWSLTGVVVDPNTLQSKDDGVAERSELVTVSLSVRVMYRVFHHSIERDKERTVDTKNIIVSDNQSWKFITPSWLAAFVFKHEGANHINHFGDQSMELNFMKSPGTRFIDSRFKYSPLCFVFHFA